MTSVETYTTIKLLNGSDVQIAICRGGHVSRAIQSHSRDKGGYDITIYLMQEICTIDDKRKDVEYYAGLLTDDYMKIMSVLNDLIRQLQ